MLRCTDQDGMISRFQLTLDLFEAGIEIMRNNLKRKHPSFDADEIERSLDEWLLERDGAKHGDAVGRVASTSIFEE